MARFKTCTPRSQRIAAQIGAPVPFVIGVVALYFTLAAAERRLSGLSRRHESASTWAMDAYQ